LTRAFALAFALALALALPGCGAGTEASGTRAAPRTLLAGTWFLPPHFSKRADALVVAGDGRPLGRLYAHSDPIAVAPRRVYRAAVTLDTRFARGKICFYLAELTSGRGLDVECAASGKVRRYTIVSQIPSDVRTVAWVAFVDDATIAAKAVVTYRDPELVVVKRPVSASENLLSP
jgi:hypothetical protein